MTETVTRVTSQRTLACCGNSRAAVVTADLVKVASLSRKEADWKQLEFFNALSEEEQVSKLPFCVANISLEQFHAKCDELEKNRCFRWEFVNGSVYIYEMPYAVHEYAARAVIWKLRDQLGKHFDDDISVSGSPRCNAGRWAYEPDESMTVCGIRLDPGDPDAADSQGNKWPNIIVEVANSELESHARIRAHNWLQTAPRNGNNGVQQVIVIKIGPNNPSARPRTMMALRFERGAVNNPVQTIDFGDDGAGNGATVAGLRGMQLLVPVASVYLPNNPPDDLADPLMVDLFYVRRAIERAIRMH